MSEEPKSKLPLNAINAKAFEIVLELPASKYRGIGKIVSAHAILEGQIFELLCELSSIDPAVGRVTLRYQAASERFKLIRKLLILHGIPTKTGLKPLFKEIEDCCRLRDTFAHGVWVKFTSKDKYRNEEIGLTLTKGEFEADGGIVDRSFRPQISSYSSRFFSENQRLLLAVADKISALRDEIGHALLARPKANA